MNHRLIFAAVGAFLMLTAFALYTFTEGLSMAKIIGAALAITAAACYVGSIVIVAVALITAKEREDEDSGDHNND